VVNVAVIGSGVLSWNAFRSLEAAIAELVTATTITHRPDVEQPPH